MIQLEDIGGESCESQAGISKIYYAKYEDFESIEDLPDDICCSVKAIPFSQLVEIPETGTIKSTLIGEKKRRLFENELVCELAGSNAELLGFPG